MPRTDLEPVITFLGNEIGRAAWIRNNHTADEHGWCVACCRGAIGVRHPCVLSEMAEEAIHRTTVLPVPRQRRASE